MNYVERMVERGRQMGRQEGELKGKVQIIQGLLGRDVPWSTIEAATGIDEANSGVSNSNATTTERSAE